MLIPFRRLLIIANISFRLEVEDIYIQKLKNWDSKWKKNLETKADEFTKKSVSGKLNRT